MNDEAKQQAPKIRGKRSPNYPILGLDKAIDMVTKLYKTYHQNGVPAPLAMEAMGYSIKSGRAVQMLAAISYYGLVDVERGGKEDKKVSVTSLAVSIIKNPNTIERAKAIKHAALRPAIFKKILMQFPNGLPADRLLAWELESKHDFNPKTINDFISIFRKTISFADFSEKDIIEEETDSTDHRNIDEEEDINMLENENTANTISQPRRVSMKPSTFVEDEKGKEREIANYPIGRGLKARILVSGDSSVTHASIDKLIKLLEINKEDLPEDVEEKSNTPTED